MPLPIAYPVPPAVKRAVPDSAERALWFGTPAAALRLLATGQDSARRNWLRGVALLALGRYEPAEEVLSALLPAGTGPDPDGALAAATLGSAYRQRTRYAAARDADLLALAAAGTSVEARADALVGLTADAVGAGSPGEAADRLAALDELLADRGAAGREVADGEVLDRGRAGCDVTLWRAAIRRHWVACELALAGDRPTVAVREARVAVRCAEVAQAPRHLAKSLLFCGVSTREVARRASDVTRLRSALVILRRSERLAAAIEVAPIQAVAHQTRWEAQREVGEMRETVAQNTSAKTAS